MHIQQLWEFSKGESQTIAFIDTGLSDELQMKYQSRIVYSYNIADDNEAVIDHHGHGTEMVSVACGDGFSNIFGVAPAAIDKTAASIDVGIDKTAASTPSSISASTPSSIGEKGEFASIIAVLQDTISDFRGADRGSRKAKRRRLR